MRRLFTLIILCFLICGVTKAQTIPDSEFKWIKDEKCLPSRVCLDIYLKVEQDPMLTQFNRLQFNNFIRQTIDELNLLDGQTGILKLKLLFAKYQNLCVAQLGMKSLELNQDQINEITDNLNTINRFKIGKQKNIEVNCLGLLYINIINGKFDKTRNVNFEYL